MYDEYEYKQYIRKFATCDVLQHYAKESINIYNSTENNVKFENIAVYNKKTGLKSGVHQIHIAQWDLLEICFNSIKYSNDYRNVEIDKNAHYNMINLTKKRAEILEQSSGLTQENLFKHLMCIANMEFDLEKIAIKNRFNRIYHIMTNINKNAKYDQTNKVCYIDFLEMFYKITEFDYDTYIRGYFLICALVIGTENPDILSVIEKIDLDISIFGISKENLIKLLTFQSKDYEFYKHYDNWNILKYFPIVKTKKDSRLIISNLSALLICFSESMYWTIRNYYCEKGSRDFTSYFGHCFEFYMNELFETYNIEAEKLEEKNNGKRPDWKLETKKYIFYIEQKAALYPMETRSIISSKRIDTLNNYVNTNIKKAFIQLNSYEEKSSKIIIRICLTFETIYFPETLQDLVIPKISLKGETYLNWIVSINEFEKLMYILSSDEDKFNSIINRKIKLEKTKSKNGRGFDTILSTEQNDFISNKINYFDNYLKKYLKKYNEDA